MKSITIIFAIGIFATVSAQTGPPMPPIGAQHDGQPGCATRYEFRRLWRNNMVPEQFWECRQWQEPARVRYCAPATRFQDSWQTCVPYEQWQWTPYMETPTRPGIFSGDMCERLEITPEDECQFTETTTGLPVTTFTPTTEWVTGGSTPTPTPVTTYDSTTPQITTELVTEWVTGGFTPTPVTSNDSTTPQITTEWATVGSSTTPLPVTMNESTTEWVTTASTTESTTVTLPSSTTPRITTEMVTEEPVPATTPAETPIVVDNYRLGRKTQF